jgi:hypothetical protein
MFVPKRQGVVGVGFDGVVRGGRECACTGLVVVPLVPLCSFPARGWGPVVVLEEPADVVVMLQLVWTWLHKVVTINVVCYPTCELEAVGLMGGSSASQLGLKISREPRAAPEMLLKISPCPELYSKSVSGLLLAYFGCIFQL